jgi:hypothetical protein
MEGSEQAEPRGRDIDRFLRCAAQRSRQATGSHTSVRPSVILPAQPHHTRPFFFFCGSSHRHCTSGAMSMLAHAASATAAAVRSAARPSSAFLAAVAPVTRRTLSLQPLHQHRGVHSSAPVRVESVSMVDEKEWLEGEGRAEAREHALRKRHQQAAAQKAAAANDVGVGQSLQQPSACAAAKPADDQRDCAHFRSSLIHRAPFYVCHFQL